MANVLKFNSAVRFAKLSAAPSGEEGMIYFNTSSGDYQLYENGAFRALSSEALEAHLVDAAGKHDASQIDFEDDATSAKNLSAGSVEAAITALDDAIGTLNQGSNYTAGDATAIGSHLDAIDSALASISDDQTAAEVPYTPAVLTDWDGDADPGSTKDALDQLAERVDDNEIAISGSATVHSDISAGDITNLGNLSGVNSGDEAAASDTVSGIVELATIAETDTGTDATRALTPAGLAGSALQTKVDGIEASADVTDATNVDAAGAVMESDATTAGMSFVLDEDTMTSDSATKLATQQSIKAYVDTEVASAVSAEMTFQGDYNAATNAPDLDTTPIATAKGDMYVVTVAGTFFATAVEIGDILIAKQATATLEAHWSIVQANLTPASIKSQYESNTDTNAYTDADQTVVGNTSGTNTGDEPDASATVKGIVELATIAEVDTGTDTVRAITPAGLAGSALQTKVDGIEAGADVTDATNVDAAGAVMESDATTAGMSFVLDEDAMGSDSATKLATQQSIKAYADTKMADLSDDTTPSLGGDLTLGANVVIHDGDGLKRGSSASNFLEEEYIHAITLTASQTDAVASDLTFAHASFEGAIIDYKIKEATTNRVRIGQIFVATEGTNVSVADTFTETGDAGVTWDAAVNGANVEVKYTTTANNKTMRCDVKRVKA